MSRLSTISPEALSNMFSTESDKNFITLLTITSTDTSETTGLPEPIRLCDSWTGRLPNLTTDDEVVYGVVSNEYEYIYLPLEITLPTEEEGQAPRCSIVIKDVTRYLTPIIRKIVAPLEVTIDIVLESTPDIAEVRFEGFYINSITYNKDTVTADLSMLDLEQEPFPVYSFSPSYFPGLF